MHVITGDPHHDRCIASMRYQHGADPTGRSGRPLRITSQLSPKQHRYAPASRYWRPACRYMTMICCPLLPIAENARMAALPGNRLCDFRQERLPRSATSVKPPPISTPLPASAMSISAGRCHPRSKRSGHKLAGYLIGKQR